jgi:hypothetical protein
MPVVGVEAEEERRDLRPPAGFEAHACHDAVRGLVRLHLHDALARAGQIGEAEPLGDHPVEPRRLEGLQPVSCRVDVVGDGRERDPVGDLLELGTSLLDRPLVHGLALPQQEVEGDVRRRDLGGELSHAALGGVEPRLHRIEVELAVT